MLHQRCFRLIQGKQVTNGLLFVLSVVVCSVFFFVLLICSNREQIFVDVKIRHSSLILKEVLLISTNKPQDGGEGSNV